MKAAIKGWLNGLIISIHCQVYIRPLIQVELYHFLYYDWCSYVCKWELYLQSISIRLKTSIISIYLDLVIMILSILILESSQISFKAIRSIYLSVIERLISSSLLCQDLVIARSVLGHVTTSVRSGIFPVRIFPSVNSM